MFDQLFQLGVSLRVIKRLFVLEIGIIAMVTNVSALLLGTLIAQYSLNIFNQMVAMFYFNLSGADIMLHWSIILKSIIASAGSFSVAYISYFYGKGRASTLDHGSNWIDRLLVVTGLIFLFKYPVQWVVIGCSLAMIVGGFLEVYRKHQIA